MSIRINSIEKLIEKLDEDIQWRKKEIVDIRTYCQNNDNPKVLLRAAFVLCCAHFEGAIKYASNAYVAYIASQGFKGKELRVEISSILIRKKKCASLNVAQPKKVKISVVSDILSAYDELLENQFYIKLSEDDLMPEIDETDPPLSTGGNPTPDVLAEISKILGVNYVELFQLREPFINSELLKPRHEVAHGEHRQIDIDELNSVCDFVLEIIEQFKCSIIDAAISKVHLRNPG